ncbi:fluoride efflux transporter FluC [Cellulomonas xiejunii]|uniref:Fluoride-specific ion channel FluC n=1 Tax=Cellulomonas xiejunii TaxID=2968083 RepID=A0ABY5KUT1_9CELL|nr:CrcB family protein [Cellulomonas xiejunii]MCC2322988.1 CrcB family protein [Cellulomonas xiejunii]UUI73485.1 CrcB family protein [Cellulomonas xiejunii]
MDSPPTTPGSPGEPAHGAHGDVDGHGAHATDAPAPKAARRPHVALSAVALVFVGGAVGVAVREGLTLDIHPVDQVAVAIPVVNVLAALVLGYLYEALARSAPGTLGAGRVKLLIGTGFCGGLSTYSSFATDSAKLLLADRAGAAALYALGTLLLGALATLAGIAIGARLHPQPVNHRELRSIEGHAWGGRS